MTKKKNNNIFEYKPSNPNDPKMPLIGEERKINKINEDDFLDEKLDVIQQNVEKIDSENDKETLIADIKIDNSNAKSIIQRLKEANLKKERLFKEKESEETEQIENKIVLPDPNSDLNILNSFKRKMENSNNLINKTQEVIKTLRSEPHIKLTEAEKNKIIKAFKFKVIKITNKEIILKNNKYGFEIYHNNTDKRYWVITICFEELWDPKKTNYVNLWSGNSFIGYGFNTLDECINQTSKLMSSGKTGNIIWKDFVSDWNKDTKRFIASDVAKKFSYEEYKRILKWYYENKIWILVKQENIKDYEDIMQEAKEKRKKGEQLPALFEVQAKLMEAPRKTNYIFGYPVENPKYKGKEYENPENKLYEIAFGFSE